MQRLLAVLLVLIGLGGLVLGRLGETTWAPATETTATVQLEDPGPAVVIDPGVLYVGGEQGELVIEGASDVSVITASNDDIEAYLDGVHHTRITGASDWSTLSTEEVEPDGDAELSDPTTSDLWRGVDTQSSPFTLDVNEFWAGENGENEQVYRELLIVTDGTEPGAEQVSITWPVEDENEWVPFAYAIGAAVAVVGLVLLVVSLGRGRGGGERAQDELSADAHPEVESSDAEPSADSASDAEETAELDAAVTPEGASESGDAEPEDASGSGAGEPAAAAETEAAEDSHDEGEERR